jgi:hypothetical protein
MVSFEAPPAMIHGKAFAQTWLHHHCGNVPAHNIERGGWTRVGHGQANSGTGPIESVLRVEKLWAAMELPSAGSGGKLHLAARRRRVCFVARQPVEARHSQANSGWVHALLRTASLVRCGRAGLEGCLMPENVDYRGYHLSVLHSPPRWYAGIHPRLPDQPRPNRREQIASGATREEAIEKAERTVDRPLET